MTAQTTPRLGLQLPSTADVFKISDFDDQNNKLDDYPGIYIVPNYSSMPSGWGTNQHGLCVLELDNNALWQWSKPGAAAGKWVRLNATGMLASNTQTQQFSTSSADESTGPVLVSQQVTAPGSRSLIIYFRHYNIVNDGNYGASRVTLYQDGNVIARSLQAGSSANKGVTHVLLKPISGLSPGETHTYKVRLSSLAAAGGGTSTASADGEIYVWEI